MPPSFPDVFGLRALVPADEEQDHRFFVPRKVDPVTRSEGEPGLPDPVAHRLVVAEVSEFKTEDAGLDACADWPVQALKPITIGACAIGGKVFLNVELHEMNVSYMIRMSRQCFAPQ